MRMSEPPNKASLLAARLENVDVATGMGIIEASTREAVHFDVIGDAMCIMHSDGSTNIVDSTGSAALTVEVISPAGTLQILKHYRPFKELYKRQVQ